MKPSGCVAGQPLREPLGEPRAARIDADERGVVRDGAAHALDELRRALPRRRADRQSASCASSNHACRMICAATASRARASLRARRDPRPAARCRATSLV